MTRNNVDMKEIGEEFNKQYGVPLSRKIEEVALGNYKDFLVSLIDRINENPTEIPIMGGSTEGGASG